MAASMWRVLFSSLLIFELLVWLKVIPLTVTFTIIGLMITQGAVWLVLEVIQARLRCPYQWWIMTLIVLAVMLDAAGDFFHWYAIFRWYDAALHLFASGVAALWVWNIAMLVYGKRAAHKLIFISTFAIAVTMGVAYEIEEYLEDYFTGSHRLGDGFDTANDLLLNTIGALGAVLIVRCRAIDTLLSKPR